MLQKKNKIEKKQRSQIFFNIVANVRCSQRPLAGLPCFVKKSSTQTFVTFT